MHVTVGVSSFLMLAVAGFAFACGISLFSFSHVGQESSCPTSELFMTSEVSYRETWWCVENRVVWADTLKGLFFFFLPLLPDSAPLFKALLAFQQSSAVVHRDNRWDTSVSVAANKWWLELTPEGTGCPCAEKFRVPWVLFWQGHHQGTSSQESSAKFCKAN